MFVAKTTKYIKCKPKSYKYILKPELSLEDELMFNIKYMSNIIRKQSSYCNRKRFKFNYCELDLGYFKNWDIINVKEMDNGSLYWNYVNLLGCTKIPMYSKWYYFSVTTENFMEVYLKLKQILESPLEFIILTPSPKLNLVLLEKLLGLIPEEVHNKIHIINNQHCSLNQVKYITSSFNLNQAVNIHFARCDNVLEEDLKLRIIELSKYQDKVFVTYAESLMDYNSVNKKANLHIKPVPEKIPEYLKESNYILEINVNEIELQTLGLTAEDYTVHNPLSTRGVKKKRKRRKRRGKND